MNGSMFAALGTLAGLLTLLIGTVVLWIMYIIGYWKMFSKAGEPGWKSIIPVYNAYISYKICWNPMFFALLILLAIVSGMLSYFFPGVFAIQALQTVITLAMAAISIVQCAKLSKVFGKGTGFTLGLIFFNPIFVMILGLGKAKYVGKEIELDSANLE